MKIFFKFFILITLFTNTSLFASEIVATVNNVNISEEDVNDFVVKSIPGATFRVLNEEQKKAVVNQMIERRLFLEDAKAIHISNTPEYIIELARLREKLKEKLLLDYWMKKKVEEIAISRKEAHDYYIENLQNFSQPSSVKVRHILVTSKSEARSVISALNLSESLEDTFIELAKINSIGPSGKNGGELDWFFHEQMVSEFSDAAFSLKLGTITQEPIQTQFGYHVIYLQEKKQKGLVPFSSAKEDIIKHLRMEKFKIKLKKLSETLKKTAKIIVK